MRRVWHLGLCLIHPLNICIWFGGWMRGIYQVYICICLFLYMCIGVRIYVWVCMNPCGVDEAGGWAWPGCVCINVSMCVLEFSLLSFSFLSGSQRVNRLQDSCLASEGLWSPARERRRLAIKPFFFSIPATAPKSLLLEANSFWS